MALHIMARDADAEEAVAIEGEWKSGGWHSEKFCYDGSSPRG